MDVIRLMDGTGFKLLTQAQLLGDELYFSVTDGQQLLIYYVSRPLLGLFEPNTVVPAVVTHQVPLAQKLISPGGAESPGLKKKDVKTFSDLLNNFPMIARQMQPGLERLFNELGKELGKPLPAPPSRPSSLNLQDGEDRKSVEGGHGSSYSKSNGNVKFPFTLPTHNEDEEDHMRRALESAATAAIDLFQVVDKQQLSFLGATTELTGPLVERLIERYVAEQVHHSLLFPRLCDLHRTEDQELDHRIRQLENIDVAQVGIAIEGGKRGKDDLIRRLNRGHDVFRKMGVASSPHEMLEILLDTEKAITEASTLAEQDRKANVSTEKPGCGMTINADVLVSLLLIVVIRSQVRHLQARLSYMQRFIYIDDVEGGEIGYALSTFEGVLTYLTNDSNGLRRASQRNRRLWDATKTGQVAEIEQIFQCEENALVDDKMVSEVGVQLKALESDEPTQTALKPGLTEGAIPGTSMLKGMPAIPPANLSHVFPFQAESTSISESLPARVVKKVSIDTRSLSGSSAFSFTSRTATMESTLSGIEGDMSVNSLTQTQDPSGNSVLMMAVEARQPESLRYILTLSEFYTCKVVLEDVSNEGTTLLSAAIQLAQTELVNIILDFIRERVDGDILTAYLANVDLRGRTVAHYLFNAPQMMSRLGDKLPWRQRDKIGQTPLFALCRSYDHPDYNAMVSEGLDLAKRAQGDGMPLRLDQHTDNRGNTLLHIVNDPQLTHRILQQCDSDPNAVNDKKFTPLMLASKYGRVDLVRVFFSDARIDIHLKELRGLTAVELAKDDEIRNRIDDLTLLSIPSFASIADTSGRITTVVRSYFVEDGTIRFTVKSGAPQVAANAAKSTYTVTTSRRSLQDFEDLGRWLALEQPASYMPHMFASNFRSPFEIHSKPSRAVLHDIQATLDRYLQILLAHPTFGIHESLWEFILVPDMQPDLIAQRSKLKSQLLTETIADEYDPVANVRDVAQLIQHSRDMIRGVNNPSRSVIRRGHQLLHAHADLSEALAIASAVMSTMGPPANLVSKAHAEALTKYASLMSTSWETSPLAGFVKAVTGFHTTILAIQTSFLRPTNMIARIGENRRAIERNRQELNSQSLPRKFNFLGLEESRMQKMRETEKKIRDKEEEIVRVGKELRYTQEVVLGELAGWTEWRERVGRQAVKAFVRELVTRERERGRGLDRCLRALREAKGAMEMGPASDETA